jgi:hypothetical protein
MARPRPIHPLTAGQATQRVVEQFVGDDDIGGHGGAIAGLPRNVSAVAEVLETWGVLLEGPGEPVAPSPPSQ